MILSQRILSKILRWWLKITEDYDYDISFDAVLLYGIRFGSEVIQDLSVSCTQHLPGLLISELRLVRKILHARSTTYLVASFAASGIAELNGFIHNGLYGHVGLIILFK
jgi:hypothetical protein